MSTAYLAFDLHANTTTFGWMNAEGTYRDENTFDASASRMIRHVAEVPSGRVICTFEEDRDAKQHTGLTDYQARSEKKIDFHLNMSAAAVGVLRLLTQGVFASNLPPRKPITTC